MSNKNAAELLYDLFMKWWEDSSYPSGRADTATEIFEDSKQAVVYLSEIELFIESSGHVPERHPIRTVMPKYWAWSLGYPRWDYSNEIFLSDTEIGLLYDFRHNPIHQFGKPVLETFEASVEALPTLIQEVDSDSSLNTEVKNYVKSVLHHAYKVLSVDSLASSFDKQRALSELSISLNLAAFQTKDEKRNKKWKKFSVLAGTAFLTGFFTGAGETSWSLAIEQGPAIVQEITEHSDLGNAEDSGE